MISVQAVAVTAKETSAERRYAFPGGSLREIPVLLFLLLCSGQTTPPPEIHQDGRLPAHAPHAGGFKKARRLMRGYAYLIS
jgi:hypothetical protein